MRTAAATAIGFWAIDAVRMGEWGNYGWAHNTATTDACDLEWDGKRGAPVNGRVLYTRQANPEQSNPPREVTPKSVCRDSDVPPQTYG